VPSKKLSVNLERGTARGIGAACALDLKTVLWKLLPCDDVDDDGKTLALDTRYVDPPFERVLLIACFAMLVPALNHAMLDDDAFHYHQYDPILNTSVTTIYTYIHTYPEKS